MQTMSGNVEAKSKKGNSIRLGDDWFGVFSASDLEHVNRGDDVVFNWEASKCGNFKNIKGKVRISTGASPAGGAKPKSGGYSNTGVELGHASNLAMRMMEQTLVGSNLDIGSADYYRKFLRYTEEMYKLMKGVRAKVDAGEDIGSSSPVETDTPSPMTTDENDVF